MRFTAREIADAAGGAVIAGAPDAEATSYAIDSRLIDAGGCFFALEGDRDGHDYAEDAFRRGASVAVVRRSLGAEEPSDGNRPRAVVQVGDPLRALQALGGVARARLVDATVVGITGSAGKTATKDLTAAAVRGAHQVHASPASYNNEAGLPLTLLGAAEGTEIVVTEMGARFAGNIAELTEIARPSVGIVTHVGMAHAEHLGGRAGIARVKGELLEALPTDGIAVLNAECDATPGLGRRTRARLLLVGRQGDVDVRVTGVTLDDELRPRFTLETPWGSASPGLAMRGEHQVENAAMAATAALALGTPLATVVEGLRAARTAALRMEIVRTRAGVTLINDSYNSSPTSAAAAVRALSRLPVEGRRIAVLGEMLELGVHADAEHAALGALAATSGIDLLIAVGAPAPWLTEGARAAPDAHIEVQSVPDAAGAAAALHDVLHAGDGVLVKASRAVGLERVADDVAHGSGR